MLRDVYFKDPFKINHRRNDKLSGANIYINFHWQGFVRAQCKLTLVRSRRRRRTRCCRLQKQNQLTLKFKVIASSLHCVAWESTWNNDVIWIIPTSRCFSPIKENLHLCNTWYNKTIVETYRNFYIKLITKHWSEIQLECLEKNWHWSSLFKYSIKIYRSMPWTNFEWTLSEYNNSIIPRGQAPIKER